MRILDRYIVREVVRHALLGLIIFTFVLFVPKLVRLMELFVRHSGSGSQIAVLFLCIIPSVLVFTIPMSVLVGVLLGLGRMSMDSEIIALTALGISRKRILLPVGVLAVLGAVLTLVMTVWLAPKSLRTLRSLEADILSSQSSFQIQPRVFNEFQHMVLYVNDVAASGAHWNGIFLAEAGADSGTRITLAESAIVITDAAQGKLELHLNGGSTHELNPKEPGSYSVTDFGRSDWPIQISDLGATAEHELSNPERSLSQLWHEHGKNWRDARVELHQRFAFPIACFVFALVAVPLGAQPRRGGRAAGTLLAVLVIGAYYLLFIMGAGLSRQGVLPAWIGMWGANAVLALAGLALLPRMERYRGEARTSTYAERLAVFWRLLRRRKTKVISKAVGPRPENGYARAENGAARAENGTARVEPGEVTASRVHTIIDLYLLRRFFYNFLTIMGVFILLFQTFTFFELLDDIARHRIPFLIVVNYFRYLVPYLLYQLTPLAALVSVLVTLGVMSKNNEIIAFKASGISLYRLAVPLLLAGAFLAGSLLVLDSTYLPYANQRQDALRNQIKGRPPQTYTRPQRWIFGENSKIYNYDLFDPKQNLFGGLTVIELDPSTFDMRRRIFATRANWLPTEKAWVLESGWVRDFTDGKVSRYAPFKVTSLPELSEPPSYFNREVIQAIQMNWLDLDRYIRGLQLAGFDVSTLKVQWHKKLAYPLIAPISMLLAIPFALLVGNRGAIGGIAIGVGIGIAYWAISALFEAMGGIGQLPPILAGWSPDVIFLFLALYFFFKMPT
jgi:LPS export ABC transporter permease LptF/LPS export ABC transporter permease LptG